MTQQNQGDQGVGVGEMFVKYTEKKGLPSFGFYWQGDNPALWGRRRLLEETMRFRIIDK
jgi:hypothetical protein